MSVPQVRVQVAFDSAPGDTLDKWTDITSWIDLGAGIRYGRGRQDERAQTTAHTCTLTLDNKDGRFTAASSASPYYPNLQVGKKLRVTVRLGSGSGNLVSAENASFEGGTVGDWQAVSGAALLNSGLHWSDGSRALRVTWPTATLPTTIPWAQLFESDYVIGRTYTVRARVWVTAGTPDVRIGIYGVANGASTSVKEDWTDITVTFTATSHQHGILIFPTTSTTAGQQIWIDRVMRDEGTDLGAFTTAPPPISDRYTGYVLAWPTGFPGGNVSDVLLTASDRIGYKDALRDMRAAPCEAILAEGAGPGPEAYYPLTDPSGSVAAEEISGVGQPNLQLAAYGAGIGQVSFGEGTGPASDSAPAVAFTPTSRTNGRFLTARLHQPIGLFGAAMVACFNTSTAAQQTMCRVGDGRGWTLELGTDGTGKLTAKYRNVWGIDWTLTSSSSVADGRTRVGGLKLSISGGTATATLWSDGVQVASTSYAASGCPMGTFFSVGGSSSGDLFTGTLSHVAAWAEGSPDMAVIASTILTGLAEQTVNDSLSQVATWAGVASADLVMETGSLTETDHRPTEGQAPAQVLLALASDEGGVLYVDGSGRYQLQARDHRWNRSPVLELDSQHLAASDIQIDFDTQGLANDAQVSRPKGGGARVVNKESVEALGNLDLTVSVAAAQDGDLLARAGWEANSRATPYPRISALPVDVLTMDDALTLSMADLDVGDTFTLVTLPGQAASQAFDLTVEGWAEVLSLTEWRMDLHTSRSVGLPSSGLAVSGQRLLVIDDVTTGLDMGFITGY
jgi:Carbohydrate binding domain.